jgi:hypothetical protein
MDGITRKGRVLPVSSVDGLEYTFVEHSAMLNYIGPADQIPTRIRRRIEEYAQKDIIQ